MARRAVCWPCAATLAAALVAAAVGFAVVRQSSAQASAAAVPSGVAPAVVDLSDIETRDWLLVAGNPERIAGTQLPQTLFRRCSTGVEETYAVTRDFAFERATYAELRRGNDDTWTALAWQGGFVIGVEQPRPPPHNGGTWAHGSPERAPAKRWRRQVSDTTAEPIVRDLTRLFRDSVAPVRGDRYMFDGGWILLESCVGARYRLFLRTSFDDAPSLEALADQLFTLAGVLPRDLNAPD